MSLSLSFVPLSLKKSPKISKKFKKIQKNHLNTILNKFSLVYLSEQKSTANGVLLAIMDTLFSE